MAQRILKHPVSSKDALAQKNVEELKEMFQQIEAEFASAPLVLISKLWKGELNKGYSNDLIVDKVEIIRSPMSALTMKECFRQESDINSDCFFILTTENTEEAQRTTEFLYLCSCILCGLLIPQITNSRISEFQVNSELQIRYGRTNYLQGAFPKCRFKHIEITRRPGFRVKIR
ncbi:MAG: hypothetical protein GY749_31850 [Desulfobacteraceae bacterium]|nr:hypothetical protein [Desulfobacteraceae bacterium]